MATEVRKKKPKKKNKPKSGSQIENVCQGRESDQPYEYC